MAREKCLHSIGQKDFKKLLVGRVNKITQKRSRLHVCHSLPQDLGSPSFPIYLTGTAPFAKFSRIKRYQGKILAVTNVLVQVSTENLKCKFLYRYMSCPQTFAKIPTDQRELCERGCTGAVKKLEISHLGQLSDLLILIQDIRRGISIFPTRWKRPTGRFGDARR